MGGYRVALAHTELVVGAGRAPLGLDVVRDAGQPEAALAPSERRALAVADEDHGPGLRFHHLLHPITSAARRACSARPARAPPHRCLTPAAGGTRGRAASRP